MGDKDYGSRELQTAQRDQGVISKIGFDHINQDVTTDPYICTHLLCSSHSFRN